MPAARHDPRPWRVETRHGSAAELHGLVLPEPPRRVLWLMEVDRPALVIGSAQRADSIDTAAAAAAGIEVARRRSGGGAVLLVPGEALWVDAVIPSDDPLWHDDVGVAFGWFGRAWAAALGEVGLNSTVHTGALERRAWSDLVCFAGLGPGEVTVGGAKVVGMSQRRTRGAARFQAVALARWAPVDVTALLALSPHERDAAAHELAGAAAGLTADLGVPLAAVRAALVEHLAAA